MESVNEAEDKDIAQRNIIHVVIVDSTLSR